MQHLCDGHRSPLPWIRRCDPENPVSKLVEFFFGEERVPLHLLHSEVAWNVFQHRKARHPKVARERLPEEARGFRVRELYWDRFLWAIAHPLPPPTKPARPLRTPFSAHPVTIPHAHIRCVVFITEIPSRTSGVLSLIFRARLRLGSHPSARQER